MSLKPNFKKAAKKYKKLYIKFKGYFLFTRESFNRCQVERNEYMQAYKNAVDEIDRLKLKVKELTNENIKLQAEYNEIIELTQLEFCCPLKGDNNGT